MKELFQNKKFRINLYKWIFMYVGVLMLFMTVITYSRYYSSFITNENARIAKFNVEVLYAKEYSSCSPTSLNVCNVKNTYGPSSDMYYYFTVDTSNTEVLLSLYLNVKVTGVNFNITNIEVKDINALDEEYVSIKKSNNYQISIDDPSHNIAFREKISPNTGTKKMYRITVNYVGSKTSVNDGEYFIYDYSLTQGNQIIAVDYSATQI